MRQVLAITADRLLQSCANDYSWRQDHVMGEASFDEAASGQNHLCRMIVHGNPTDFHSRSVGTEFNRPTDSEADLMMCIEEKALYDEFSEHHQATLKNMGFTTNKILPPPKAMGGQKF